MKRMLKTSLAIAASVMLVIPSVAQAVENDEVYQSASMKKSALTEQLLKSEKEQKLDAYKSSQKENLDIDTLVVRYSHTISKEIHKRAGVQVVRSIPALGYDIVYIPKGKKLSEVLKVYKNDKAITEITPSVKFKKLGDVDPKKSKMYQLQMLNIEKALKYAGNHKVVVAVIDGGVDYRHPELSSQVLPPYNAAAPAKTPVPDMHGTHVAGIIAASANNGLGGHGINPKAKILPIDVFNGGQSANDYTIAQGIMYAIEKKADIINMSLGSYNNSPILADAIQRAIDAGITVIAAAGNEATDDYSYPAAYPGVISVGNINKNKQLSESSNYGSSVDLVAPGEEIYSTAYSTEKNHTFMKLTGTSMASPVVAGVASLLKSKYPNLKPNEIEYILENTATDLGDHGYDLTFANGLVNPVAALKFDLKQLPKFKDVQGSELLKAAQPLKQEGKNSINGKITLQQEVQLFKMELKAGEHVQTVLDAAKSFDYGMDFYFFPEGSQKINGQPLEINKTRAGGQEAYLYSADMDGTLVIGIKDVNGSYSKTGKSTFTFTAEKFTSLIPNTNSMEQPIKIDSFPYNSAEQKGEPLTLFNTEGMPDSDYFTFEVNEPKVLSFTLDGLPGVNSTLSVSVLNNENKQELEYLPIIYSDDNGIGIGERLSFEAMPGMKYMLTVSNESMPDFSITALLAGLLGTGGGMNQEISFDYSAYPYNLKVEQAILPKDEDGLPLVDNLESQFINDQMTISEYADKKSTETNSGLDALLDDDGNEFSEKEIEAILTQSIPITQNHHKGYFQITGDQDYYTISPNEDAIYDISVENGPGQLINSSIYEYDPDLNMLMPYSNLSGGLGDILSLLLGIGSSSSYVPLKKDTQYIIKLENDMGNISADPYLLTVDEVATSPEKDEDLNSFETAVDMIKGKTYQNYFIYPGDTDYYYYQHHGANQIMDLKIQEKQRTAMEKGNLPADLFPSTIFSGMLIEDTNGNKQIDNDEILKSIPIGASLFDLSLGDIDVSFKAQNGVGYFVVLNPLIPQVNLNPYEVKMIALKDQKTDEDGEVTNHIPKKPLVLKKQQGKLIGQGYMNAGVPFGDIDHFRLDLKKTTNVSMMLEMEKSLDGVIEIYNSKGKLIKRFDDYGESDEELAKLKLNKGTYYIEISEATGKAGTEKYKLTISLN
ncbi:S8 family peptidase [Heyndrickxia oleronia]|uniref:S8 family peptidase n=1 Tax=Heyndrickxia oleronia TaxID=38875 RepID=UPI00242A4DD7|nr:S8 family serine peptidase [Heyndrickxia oleronia]MCI1590552.1 S8 family serine peptidase [Heyndrickxia oleronia]MCI1612590.1 S8 family serine peptidase [Heyndrickxia oleronia]MCI1743818.1 S8 family serine peptidase [Heyndrickxia oleronia]MCI1760529.1 S8 family serine peptidase [Heyndrickxia oleronia]